MYINLKTRSFYSILTSSIFVDDIIDFAIKQGQQWVSLIDVNVMYGALEFYIKAKEAKLKPIVGISVNYHNSDVSLIAKNYKGYLQLCQISSLIMHNSEHDFKKLVTDDLIIISENDLQNEFANCRNFYLTKNIACHEALFANKDNFENYHALLAIKQNSLLKDLELNNKYKNNYLLTENEAKNIYSEDQLTNLQNLINTINLEIPLYKENHFVTFDKKINSSALLTENCRLGMINRFGQKVEKKYIDRLNHELDIIHNKGFDDYFLVVQDYVKFAQQNNILVGQGRGSAAGSLVSYILGITNVDPIANNLLFERFLNPERKTKPDIDIDFMDNRRQEIVDYLFNKYGKDHVAHIITFQKIKSKTAIRDAARLLDIDLKIVNMICKIIPFEYENNLDIAIQKHKVLKDFASKYEKLFQLSLFLIGLPRQIGTHAAGIVISNKNINEVIPTCLSAEEINTTQYSMEYIEACGLIKMDILGLVNLSIIDDCVKLINKQDNKFDLSKITYDDKNVFAQLASGKTVGIFQLESPGMTRVVIQIKPKSIEDISIASALFRPGPQENIPVYLKNKANPETINYVNESLKPILQDTYGIIIYQEQVIQMVCQIASFSLSQADNFRRAISKKNFDNLSSLKKDFMKGAEANGYRQKNAQEIFDYILKFASYGFNHSHSLAYSYISYQMAYLKTYYPLQFYCCLLTYNDNSAAKVNLYLNEAKKSSIMTVAPSINLSTFGFSINNNKIVFGFNAIKGIGFESVNKIINARESLDNKKFEDIVSTISTLISFGVGEKAIETLISAGCFDELFNEQVKNRTSLLASLSDLVLAAKTYTKKYGMLKTVVYQHVDSSEEIEAIESRIQQELLGVSFAVSPIVKIKDKYRKEFPEILSLSEIMTKPIGYDHFETIVYVNSVKRIKTKTGVDMAWVSLEDESANITDAVAFNNVLSNTDESKLLNAKKILALKVSRSSKSIKISSVIKELK